MASSWPIASNSSTTSTIAKQESSTTPEWDQVVAMIRKRVATFAYLRRAHEGRVHYFNTAILTKEDLASISEGPKVKKRTHHWFVLGVSLGGLLEIDNPIDYIRGLVLLVQEYEYYTAKGFISKQKMKQIFRKKTKSPESGSNTFVVPLAVHDTGEYTYLDIRNIPFDLDYFQTFYTLCDVVCEVYYKILDEASSLAVPGFFEALLRIDNRLKKIISVVTSELDGIIQSTVKEELKCIDPLRGSALKMDLGEDDDESSFSE